MKARIFFLMALSLFVLQKPRCCQAQTASDPNAGSKLEWDATNSIWRFKWWGKLGNTYFIQHSEDLQTWTWVPVVEAGDDSIKEWGFTSTGNKFFLRLRYTDAVTSFPEDDDFDGDGVSNLAEVQQGTDPFHNADSDSDGLSDDAEVSLGFNPNDAYSQDPSHTKKDGDKDKDGSGIPNSWMVQYFKADPSRWPSSYEDGDQDGMTNLEEFNASFFDSGIEKWVGPNPSKINTDGDGKDDGLDGWATQSELSPPRLPITHYAVIPIPDSGNSLPLFVNNKGHVVYSKPDGTYYFWDGGTPIQIQKMPGATSLTGVAGLNNNDFVAINQSYPKDVSYTVPGTSPPEIYLGQSVNQGAALWTPGGFTPLGNPPNLLTTAILGAASTGGLALRSNVAYGLNDSNIVYGGAFEYSVREPFRTATLGLIWSPSVIAVGDTIVVNTSEYYKVEQGGNSVNFRGINSNGKVIGNRGQYTVGYTLENYGHLPASAERANLFWQANSLSDIGGTDSLVSINDLGHIVINGGFLLNGLAASKLLLPNSPLGYVNNKMQSVSGNAIWQNNKWHSLSALIPYQWGVENAKQISSDTGFIVASGGKIKNDDGTAISPYQNQSLLLLPIDFRGLVREYNSSHPDAPGGYVSDSSDPSGHKTRSLNELKISNWEIAFNPITDLTPKATFADDDPFTTFIRITDPSKAGQGTIQGKLKISTSFIRDVDEDFYGTLIPANTRTQLDPGNTVDLFEVAGQPGVFQTKGLMLMADAVDDSYQIDGKADNAPNDRSFMAMPGADVDVEYEMAPNVFAKASIKVECKKTIKVQAYILKSTTGDVVSLSTASDWMRCAAQRMAQAGIRMDWKVSTIVGNPTGVDMSAFSGLSQPVDDGHGKFEFPPETRYLFDGLPVGAGDIGVYFVNSFSSPSGLEAMTTVDQLVNTADKAYANRILVDISKNPINWVIAHELIHLLANAVHGDHAPITNAMITPRDFPDEELRNQNLWHNVDRSDMTVGGMKRLWQEQINRMQKSPYAK